MDNAIHISHAGMRRTRETELRSIQRAEQAVTLDPVDSRAHLCLGWSLALAKRYERAKTHMGEAVRLNPLDPWSLVAAALFHAFQGEHDTAQSLAADAMALAATPFPAHWVYHSAVAYLRGDHEFAVECATRTQSTAPSNRAWHAAALHQLGRQREAEEMARQFLEGARAEWFGREDATDEAIGHWFMHLFPIARPAEWERLRDGVVGAGIPVGASRHHGW